MSTNGNGSGQTPNDQRSNVKNPNNPQHKDDKDNRSDQKNPNNPAYPGNAPTQPKGK